MGYSAHALRISVLTKSSRWMPGIGCMKNTQNSGQMLQLSTFFKGKVGRDHWALWKADGSNFKLVQQRCATHITAIGCAGVFFLKKMAGSEATKNIRTIFLVQLQKPAVI